MKRLHNILWKFGSDGMPYVLGQKIRENDPAYQNLLLLPGPGHFEMNMTKCLFKLLWPVGLSETAKHMGFTSLKAQEYMHKGGDHHKAWALLKIFHEACLQALVKPYVMKCQGEGILPTSRGYYVHNRTVSDPISKYLVDMNLNYIMALFMYRQGIRTGNSNMALAGRLCFGPLFYSTNMTIYMQVHYEDIATRIKGYVQPIMESVISDELKLKSQV